MKPKKRQKLCYNCEGDVDLDVIVCPFCAADLREEKSERASFSPSAHSVKHLGGSAVQQLEAIRSRAAVMEDVQERPDASLPEIEEEVAEKPIWMGAAVFAAGFQLALLAVLLLFFQSNGTVILKWDARLWFLYLFAAIPVLILGYRMLAKADR